MATLTIRESGLPEYEDGYVGFFKGVQEKKYAYGDRLTWRFEVTEGPHAGEEGYAFSGTEPTRKSNCGRYLSMLAGQDIPTVGMEVDVESFIGKPYKFTVATPSMADSPRVVKFHPLTTTLATSEASAGKDDDNPFNPSDAKDRTTEPVDPDRVNDLLAEAGEEDAEEESF